MVEQAPNVRDYLSVLRRRKWIILVVTALVIGVAVAYASAQPAVYQSSAQVLVEPISFSTQDTASLDTLNLETEALIATSPQVAKLATSAFGSEADALAATENLSVTIAQDTNVLIFEFTAPTAAKAQAGAQAFAQAYLDDRHQGAEERLSESADSIQLEIDSLQARLDDINNQIASTDDPEQQATAQNEADSLSQQILFARTRLFELASPTTLDVGQVLYDAQLPGAPSNPTPLKMGLIGLFAGLALGVALAFLRERLDDRLGGRADLEEAIEAPVLSVVPRVNAWRDSKQAYLVTERQPQSTASEAYRTLRTAVLFAASQYDIGTILVTSAHAKEGKSATSANLATVLGQAGKKVIVVSADLRRPRLEYFFEVPQGDSGLANVLASEATIDDVLVPAGPASDNVQLLPSGPVPGNPAELLGSDAMSELLGEARGRADFVIIDATPVLAVTDAMALAPMCDGVLFITDASKTSRNSVAQARQQLAQVNAHLIGGVLHNFDPSKGPAYSAYTSHSYTYRIDPEPKAKLRALPWGRARER